MNDDAPLFRYSVELRDGYVFVEQSGKARELGEVEAMQEAIDMALAVGETRLLMFYNRATLAPDPWIRASMWTWLSSRARVHRVAMLNKVAKIQRRVRQSGERNRVWVEVFDNAAEASRWLRDTE